jgi:hypothetical protein
MGMGHDAGHDIVVGIFFEHMFKVFDAGQDFLGDAGVAFADRVFGSHDHIATGTKGDQIRHRHCALGQGTGVIMLADHLA